MARLTVEQRREAAIDATLRVIAQDGVEAATTRRIAAEAQMGQSSIFYAFASRDELLAAVVERGVADELEAMSGWLDSLADLPAGTSIEDVIRTGLNVFVESTIADPARQQVLVGLTLYARRTSGLGHLAERLYEGYYATAADVLDEASRISGAAWQLPPAELAPILIALTDGITLCWLGTQSRTQLEAVVANAVRVLVGYVA